VRRRRQLATGAATLVGVGIWLLASTNDVPSRYPAVLTIAAVVLGLVFVALRGHSWRTATGRLVWCTVSLAFVAQVLYFGTGVWGEVASRTCP
jgi:hypothetical protein